jgi:hypothetical protein
MIKTSFMVLLLVTALIARVNVSIGVNLGVPVTPVVVTAEPQEFEEAPQVVFVTPGVYIVPDSPEEIFFSAGLYWTLRDGSWYQCRGHHQKWVRTRGDRVPPTIMRMPRGRYKNWHENNPRHHGEHHGR